MFTVDHALRTLYYRKKKHFAYVVENRGLHCIESIFVNLPQFAKSGLKESLNRFFWYFSLHLFGYFGVVSSLFVSVSVCFHSTTFDRGTIEMYGWKSASMGVAEVHSSPWIRFLNLWRDGKEVQRSSRLQILQTVCLPSSFYIECSHVQL